MRYLLAILSISMTFACGDDSAPSDAGMDTSTPDGSAPDAGTDAETDAGDVDGGEVDAGTDAGFDSGIPPRSARLVVGDADGVSVFYTEDIERDETPAPDVEVATSAVAGLAAIGDRLFVAHPMAADGIDVFDDAYDIASDAAAVGTIPAAGTSALQPVDTLTADDSSIWYFQPTGAFDRYADATGAVPTAVAATFTHPFGQVHGFAIDSANDRAFGGQISGAGIQAWNAASTATGATEPDFQVSPACSAWAITVAGTRLFAGCVPVGGVPGTIQIWDDIGSLTATTAPDVTLEMDVTGAAGSIWDIAIGDDSIFVASDAGLRVWNDASTISTPRAPDQTVDTGAILRVEHAADGTVYVLGRPSAGSNVTIVRDAATAPDVWTILNGFTSAADITLVE